MTPVEMKYDAIERQRLIREQINGLEELIKKIDTNRRDAELAIEEGHKDSWPDFLPEPPLEASIKVPGDTCLAIILTDINKNPKIATETVLREAWFTPIRAWIQKDTGLVVFDKEGRMGEVGDR